jgi:septal ring factor EnvC (AmiA/AmiB activator)
VATRRRRRQDRTGELEDELARLRKEAGTAADALRQAQRGRDAAERRLRTATPARDRACGRGRRLRREA